MTLPAAKLTCDEGCSNTFATRKGLENHMKNKHDNVAACGSKSNTDNTSKVATDNASPDKASTTVSSKEDDEAAKEAKEDQELADHLEQIEKGLKDNEEKKDLIEKIQRLGVIIKNKNVIMKDTKAKHEHEISNREEVEKSHMKELEKFQAAKDRNIAILRESKKKKKEVKELEKEKSYVENELVGLRVENGILVKEITTLKIDNENKATYIKQLKKSKGPSDNNEPSRHKLDLLVWPCYWRGGKEVWRILNFFLPLFYVSSIEELGHPFATNACPNSQNLKKC